MTPSVADKTPIPNKTWRRHTDPRGLWIAVATGSIALHLMLFWLMRSSAPSLLSQQQSSANIPIEFVETSPKVRAKARPQSKAKSVSPNPPSTSRKSGATSLPKRVTSEHFTVKPAPSTEDRNTIAFSNKKVIASQLDHQFVPKKPPKKSTVEHKTVLSKSQRTVKYASIPKLEPTFSPKISDNIEPTPIPSPDTPENRNPQPTPARKTPKYRHRHRLITQSPKTPVPQNPQPRRSLQTPKNRNPEPTTTTNTQEQQDLASGNPQQSSPPPPNTTGSSPDSSPLTGQQPTPPPSPPPIPSHLPGQPGGEIKVGQETSLNKKGGGIALATWEIAPGELKKDLPDNPAKPKINQKLLNFPSLNTESNFQPKDFRVHLLIDNNLGKVISVFIYPQDLPAAQRSQYQKYAEEIFKDVEFTQATTNGKPSPTAEVVVRIKIEHR